jgi:hypothetical protein
VARRREADPAAFRVSCLLVFVSVLCLGRLLFGDDPWSGGIAERMSEGKGVRPVDFVRTYGWWAAAANLLLCLSLLATQRHWLIRGETRAVPSLRPPERMSRGFVVGTLGAVLTLALLGLPRLDHSFWDDELYSLRVAINGVYVHDVQGELEFDGVRWRDTLWHYHKPSNHVPQSVLSRVALGVWRFVARPPLHFASERVTRLPVYAAGLASLGAVALLLWRLGHPFAGVCAAWILALHPWQLRYTTEARGYGILLFLVPATLFLLTRALYRGTWRRWLLYGGSQLLLIWSFPGALFLLLVMNIATALWLWRQTLGSPSARQQATRFGMANLAGAMLGLWLMLPNVAQLLVFLARDDLATLDAPKYLPDFLSHLWLGTPWKTTFEAERFLDALDLAARWPVLFEALLWATAGLSVLGAMRLLVAGGARTTLGLIMLLPGPITLSVAWARGTFLNQWYLIFMLPVFAAWLGLGLEGLPGWVRRPGTRGALAGLVAGAYLGSFAWLTHAPRAELRALPLQPIRESVALTRPDPDPFSAQNQRILTASFQAEPIYYDPRVQKIATPDELRALMRRADAEGRMLYVNFGRPKLAEARYPALMEMLRQEHLFQELAKLYGSSPRGVRQVYRYRGAPLPGS